MTANGPGTDWKAEFIGFLSSNLPPLDGCEGWQHDFSSAYQMGCMALVALGQATETAWGAVPREDARLPDVLPRWDDICVAVLKLAGQQSKLSYRLSDGGIRPEGRVRPSRALLVFGHPRAFPAPNIAAGRNGGFAYADPETLSVLQPLGLVAKGRWTEAAETVLWRDQPVEWDVDVASDPRFIDAVERAADTVPDDIRSEMDRLLTITDADVAEAVARSAAFSEEMRIRYSGTRAVIPPPWTSERALRSLEFVRRDELD